MRAGHAMAVTLAAASAAFGTLGNAVRDTSSAVRDFGRRLSAPSRHLFSYQPERCRKHADRKVSAAELKRLARRLRNIRARAPK